MVQFTAIVLAAAALFAGANAAAVDLAVESRDVACEKSVQTCGWFILTGSSKCMSFLCTQVSLSRCAFANSHPHNRHGRGPPQDPEPHQQHGFVQRHLRDRPHRLCLAVGCLVPQGLHRQAAWRPCDSLQLGCSHRSFALVN